MKLTTAILGVAVIVLVQLCAAQDRAADSVALLAIKAANPGSALDTINVVLWDNINGGQFTNAWRPGNNINRWEGVTVTNDRVTALKLFDIGIKTIPIAPGALSELQTLSANTNQLTTFPADIRNLKKLTSLSLFSNRLSTFPADLDDIPLKKIDLHKNEYTEIPQGVFKLTQLDTIDMSQNKITAIPPELGNLTNLKRLSLGNNQITDIPAGIGNLVLLQYLSLYNNQLHTLPKELKNLVKLKTLSLSSNQLEQIDEEIIGNLFELESIGLGHNNLTTFPKKLETIPLLKTITLEHNALTSLPPEIGLLKRVETFSLDSNKLTSIPPEIGTMAFLYNFSAGYNFIDSIPPELAGLRRLESLSLRGNLLRTFPSTLHASRTLDLQSNQLQYLPENPNTTNDWTWVSDDMQYIYMQDNNLTNLPRYITRLINLNYADFSKNYLTVDSLLPTVKAWLDTTDKDWKSTQKKTAPIRTTATKSATNLAQCHPDKTGLHFTGGSFDHVLVRVLDINGCLITSGFVKKNRFEIENGTHRVMLVELRGKYPTYFKVLAGL